MILVSTITDDIHSHQHGTSVLHGDRLRRNSKQPYRTAHGVYILQQLWPERHARNLGCRSRCAVSGFFCPLVSTKAYHQLRLVLRYMMGSSMLLAASRQSFAFSRDGALPFSNWLYRMNGYTKTPVNTVWFVAILAMLLGLLAFAGTSAINAVFALSVTALYVGKWLVICRLPVIVVDRLTSRSISPP